MKDRLSMTPWISSHQLLLSEQYNDANLPHAILINGVSGSGKLELAQWLVLLLNCNQPSNQVENKDVFLQGCGYCKACLLHQSNTFPDHLNLIAEKNSLGVDDIRHANDFLQKTAYLGRYKTVLIDNAQTMTQAAMNALLKTLEEPCDNSIIILLTNDIESLLPTIISRCRVLNIRPAVGEILISQLNKREVKSGRLNVETSSLSTDSFVNLTQLPELTDTATNEAFIAFKECYIRYICEQTGELQLLQSLLNHEHALRWLEQITVNLLREYFLNNHEHNGKINAELINNLYKVIINGCKVIKSYKQANKQFVCEQLIMEISDVVEQNKIEVNQNTSG
jgi:DNA polymerase-3 subunit delta'